MTIFRITEKFHRLGSCELLTLIAAEPYLTFSAKGILLTILGWPLDGAITLKNLKVLAFTSEHMISRSILELVERGYVEEIEVSHE